MLYDLGKPSDMTKLGGFLVIFGSLVAGGLVTCILMSILARIGDVIIGW